MEIGPVSSRRWSEVPLTSGANAEYAPVWPLCVVVFQPHPPGVQVATTLVKLPSVPASNPSAWTVCGLQAVGIGVLVTVAVGVAGTVHDWVKASLRPS